VSAFNPVSTKATHVYITVYRAVATLRLGFTSQASSARAKSKDFDVVFSKELVQTVAEVCDLVLCLLGKTIKNVSS
jgi:hypothetical protein